MTSDYETATHLLPKETQYLQFSTGHNKMRSFPRLLSQVTVAVILTLTVTLSSFTYRVEDNEFTVLITASPTPINKMLTHIYKLREVVDGIKSIKATRKIHNTLSKANRIKGPRNENSDMLVRDIFLQPQLSLAPPSSQLQKCCAPPST